MAKKKKIHKRVRCFDCRHSSDPSGNSAYCMAKLRRVCASERYGRPCPLFEKGSPSHGAKMRGQ